MREYHFGECKNKSDLKKIESVLKERVIKYENLVLESKVVLNYVKAWHN